MDAQFNTIEPAIDPSNRISFLLDWELTLKCNLDCSYCATGLYGGHDNSTAHPPVSQCLPTIDFMYQYVDTYMQHKPRGIQQVVLNVYGGESLHHPDIVEILQKCRDLYHARYSDRWKLTVTTTTNAIVSRKKLQAIIPLVDEFTVSYHAENTSKQKQQFQDNLLLIKDSGVRLKCVILIHQEPDKFEDAVRFQDWCDHNGINCLPRQVDRPVDQPDSKPRNRSFGYQSHQIKWFTTFYQTKSHQIDRLPQFINDDDIYFPAETGRACCGGRQVCLDQDHQSRNFFVTNRFPDWFCSVNAFFLYVKQVTGEVFVNKDCKMNFDGRVGAIGTLADTATLLAWTRDHLANDTMPVIQCKKSNCLCGLCAPKARHRSDFDMIMRKFKK